jgi:hypothetical protein
MTRIWQDTKTFINNPPPTISNSAWYLPNLSTLPRYNEGLPGTLNFDIVRPFTHKATKNRDSSLYIAVVKGEDEYKEILVKFTRLYCIELHTFCAMQGNAPRILGY